MRELFQALSLLEGQLVSGYGITLNEAVVLCSVGDGSVLAGTIAGCTGMSPSHASKIISHVEKKGLLERKVAESDKRCMYFTLTPGFITTPVPIFAPKSLSTQTFRPDIGNNALLRNNALAKYQMNRNKAFFPGLYQELSYVDKSVFIYSFRITDI